MRICTKCNIEKNFEEFSKQKNGKFGLSPSCKACSAKKYLKYKEEYPENLKLSSFKASLKRYYKMTPDDYYRILNEQNGGCAICGTDNPGNKNWFCVDHDHDCCPGALTCGKCIRGIICDGCNRMLGCAKDNIAILKSSIRYLENFKEGGSYGKD